MKIALLEVSHWHFPLYINALISCGAEIMAVSDRDDAVRVRYADQFSCRGYAGWPDLLGDCQPDVALAFGRHAEMPAIGAALIERRIPFSIEKPAGLSAEDVARLRRAADAASVPVAVPLVQRVGPLQALLDDLVDREGARFTSTSWRFNAGPPSRYPSIACRWMLDPAISGGGCLMNLAPHFVDLALRLMPAEPDTVFARIDNSLHGQAVEDTAMISLSSRDGGGALIQTGYNFPDNAEKREYAFSLASQNHYVQSHPRGVAVQRPGKTPEIVEMNLDSDPMYGVYVTGFLADIQAGRAPATGLADLEAAMRIIDAAYRSARGGQAVSLN
jgi:predicted dehydrogenase